MTLGLKLVCCYVVLGTFIAFGQSPTFDGKLLDRKVRELPHFSGVILVARNGIPIYHKAFGYSNMADKVPNTIDTRFNMASMNKMFTGLAILKLYEEQRLDLHATVGTYLPHFPTPAVRDSVTIHQLLTHTSGMGNFWEEHSHVAKEKYRAVSDYLPLFEKQKLAFTPGSSFMYSNSGYMVLGMIIEAITGMSYETYLQQIIFAPANMKRTGSMELDAIHEKMATGYVMDPQHPGVWRNNLFVNPIQGTPAGGFYSTTGDLLNFAEALNKTLVLSKTTTDLYTQGRVPYGKGQYGYGMSEARVNGHRTIGHTGGHIGIANEFMLVEDLGYTMIVLTNGDVENYWEISSTIKDLLLGASASSTSFFFTKDIAKKVGIGKKDEALALVQHKPDSITLRESVLERFGQVALFNKRYEEAISIFSFTCEAFPDSPYGWYNLGETHRLANNKPAALENYRKYISMEPDDAEVKAKIEELMKK